MSQFEQSVHSELRELKQIIHQSNKNMMSEERAGRIDTICQQLQHFLSDKTPEQ